MIYSFKYTYSTEAGLNDPISSIKNTTFENKESKVLTYWDYKNLNLNSFKSGLLSRFHYNNASSTSFENNFVSRIPEIQKHFPAIKATFT